MPPRCFFYILIILECALIVLTSSTAKDVAKKSRALTADELNVPICLKQDECVYGGVCVKDRRGRGRCMCSTGCSLFVPAQCESKKLDSCINMGEAYTSKYDMDPPMCYRDRCVCPPQFDPVNINPPMPGLKILPAIKCDRRELEVMMVASPSDSVYKGTQATFFCCINVDPRDFISKEGVYFLQNGTRKRESDLTPYEQFSGDIDTLFTVPKCWSLTLSSVQPSDSGTYTCIAQPFHLKYSIKNATMDFIVKSLKNKRKSPMTQILKTPPRMIQNVTILSNATEAEIRWDIQEGPQLKIDLQLFRRADRKTEVWRKSNVKSPILVDRLEPAMPYTLFITVQDGQADPFILTEQFQTAEGIPNPPLLEDIRVINTETGLKCEVEWRPPSKPNGRIVKYYVQLVGKIRYVSSESRIITSDHYPEAIELCSNFDGNNENGIDPRMFPSNFYACKFGPLKPNRNYTARIWAENNAGRSEPILFKEQCVTDFAEPDLIEPPETIVGPNTTSFGLRFPVKPDEGNGPIACYYLAIVPLPPNVSLERLPAPEIIIMENVEKAHQNNLYSHASLNQRYFAYIAESYMDYPKETIVGDGITSNGVEPCNVLYLTRYKPVDSALKPELKYTGFLIIRVDRDKSLQTELVRNFAIPTSRSLNFRRTKKDSFEELLAEHAPKLKRPRRHLLSMNDPAYGFSNYFKPVILQSDSSGSSIFEVLLILFFLLLFILLTATAILYFLQKKGIIKQFCPIKKGHNLLQHAFQPISVEDLPSEYIIRHRDSDFLFSAEFEALPKPKNLTFTSNDKKENARKNRYHDIKACDTTRVKLKKLPADENSDYINANFIKGYEGRKTFIATQAPLDTTVEDFWRMVYEHDVRIIIMVANMIERGRKQCDKYWPEDDEDLAINNEFEVQSAESHYYSDYTKRVFNLIARSSQNKANGTNRALSGSSCSALSKSSNDVVNGNSVSHNRSFSSPEEKENEYANIPLPARSVSSLSNRRNLVDPKDVRRVLHYHFTNWSDLKAPECTTGILRLLCMLRKMDEYNNYPVIIHCSAGVGRTGTMIAIDYALDQCKEEGKADIFGCVSEMREQRNQVMVQSQEQYVFIYKALAEYYLFGDTDIPVDKFREHYNKLKQPIKERHLSVCSARLTETNPDGASIQNAQLTITTNSTPNSMGAILNAKFKQLKNGFPVTSSGNSNQNTPKTKLEAEFQKLASNLDTVRTSTQATKDENVHKNRYECAVPYDRNRVVLLPQIGHNSQYINASMVKGYFYPYIMAQDPLDTDTCYDFWRMINDHNSYTLVMLSTEDDFSPHEKYWPREIGTPFILGNNGEVTIQLVTEEFHPTFVQRRLAYKFKADKNIPPKEVVQFAFRGWPSGSPSPTIPVAFLDLISRVLERQSTCSDAGPIILHCRDGSFENGLFCAVSLLLERLKAEQMVDVFRTVKSLQLQRTLLFTKFEQYIFCYDSVSEYLNSCN